LRVTRFGTDPIAAQSARQLVVDGSNIRKRGAFDGDRVNDIATAKDILGKVCIKAHKEDNMRFAKNPGRWAGLLYVLVSMAGVFALVYVPSKLIVYGNATATASNMAASETLFRFGIAAQLISQILFMGVALALFDLLKTVNYRHAALMLALIVIPVPIALLNELNAVAALILVRGGGFLSIFEKPQRDALAMLLINVHGYGLELAAIFWGLWLFPLGLLVYRSAFLPRILGVLLVASGVYFLATSFTSLVLPEYETIINRWLKPLQYGELLFMAWLLIMGATPKLLADSSAE
jgi:hypothetical protein